ncbi:MAG: hypothetical protein ACYTGV_13400 [Planctomycetota bacterium]|jgi:hypothetical protein
MGELRDSGQGAQVAAQTLFQASAAANAIPVAGQFVSAGLAIAGLFTKIFGGRRRRKRREAQERRNKAAQESKAKQQGFMKPAAGGAAVGGRVNTGQAMGLAPVQAPQAASFSSWGGGTAPSVQPTQQALNNSIFTSNT